MANKRSKKRKYLTTDAEITELAYTLHICANRLREAITQINIPAAYRLQIMRHIQWMINQAKGLGMELSVPNGDQFMTKESTEKLAEQLGLFR